MRGVRAEWPFNKYLVPTRFNVTAASRCIHCVVSMSREFHVVSADDERPCGRPAGILEREDARLHAAARALAVDM